MHTNNNMFALPDVSPDTMVATPTVTSQQAPTAAEVDDLANVLSADFVF